MSAFARKLRSTVVERDHPQDGINLTYFGTPTSAGTGAGDIYAGLDRFGRVADQKWVDANNADASVEEYQYSYDRDGNVASQVNPNNTANNETFTYDNLNQLTGVSSANSSLEQSFDLDALGNADTITNGTVSTDAALNSDNQLTGLGAADLTYDADGNTVVDEQGHVQVYDAWGRLIAVADGAGNPLAAYAYDAAGRRVTQTPAGQNASEVYFAGTQDVEEDIHASGLHMNVQYVWSPVYVNALVLRDDKYSDSGSFNILDRVYALRDANYDVTALVTAFTQPGDTDNNGFVDALDLEVVFLHMGHTTGGGAAVGDLNHDGVVDETDLQLWLNNDGNTYTGPPTWQVTERLTYNADGAFTTSVLIVNSDDTTSWTANAGDYLGWNITYQGGQYDALTNLVHFGGGTDGAEGGRAVDVLTGRWTSWDPTGYPNGPDAYLVEGGNTVDRVDWSGLAGVSASVAGGAYEYIPSPNGSSPGCRAGPDITAQLIKIREEVRSKWKALPLVDQEALLDERLSYLHGNNGWDIRELAFDKPKFTTAISGIGTGANTVTIDKHAYPTEEVNYYLWGVIMRLEEETRSLTDNSMLNQGETLVSQYRTGYVAQIDTGVAYTVADPLGIFPYHAVFAPLGVDYWGWGRNIEGRSDWTAAGYFNDFTRALRNISVISAPPSSELNLLPLHWHIGDGTTTASTGGPLVLSGVAT